MILSGEWFGALALNALRHRMGSRHAIETVSARWLSQRRSSNTSRPEDKASMGLTISPTIAADRPLEALDAGIESCRYDEGSNGLDWDREDHRQGPNGARARGANRRLGRADHGL